MKKRIEQLRTPDGSIIYYEVIGNGFPLVLLHGNGGDGRFFSQEIPVFSRSFKVLTIDSRAHGFSTNQSDFLSFEQMADDLYLILKKEKIKQTNIIGFSDGANVAMVFVKKHPEMVNRLVLNAGNTKANGVFLPIQLVTWLEYFILCFCSLFSSRAKKRLPIIRLMLHDTKISTADLQQITAKTLVIVGQYDLIKHAHSMYLAKEIPQASFVVIPKQGHSLAKKVPAIFIHEMLLFLKEKKV